MSLVAYAASSGEDSDYEEDEPNAIKVELLSVPKKTPAKNNSVKDEDEFQLTPVGTKGLDLPKPKNTPATESHVDDQVTVAFSKLPMPKPTNASQAIIEEEDDEFLHKKAYPAEEELPKEKRKGPVKITIPSLRDFKDVEKDLASKSKNVVLPPKPKGSGLLSILPTAKSEQNFAKNSTQPLHSDSLSTSEPQGMEIPEHLKRVNVPKPSKPLIPDTVRTRRPATNTEGVDGIMTTTSKKPLSSLKSTKAQPAALKVVSESASEHSDGDKDDEEDCNDDGDGDFFSLNVNEKLPEVSSNEINAMVAKRAEKIAQATTKFLEKEADVSSDLEHMADIERQQAEKRLHEQQLDEMTIQALEGSTAKRRRKQKTEIEVIDISSAQVLPDREEWMRTALASSTTYQPTGVLVDEEPAAGTRKKHQITYLAHKAKANEAELQAIWAANRQTRQQSQNKYGF